ncbi:DUF58 domain-containing protein [Nocardioides carbamazepini]|uniref:DUF58 domain-containing protein n=1 Tax=Nocardioides carbamazepini TaxID=2854259 RepID=UPI002149B289|nr:DUF58 domain-containing protein [Nocardioides carbamazepini]MCR1785899.1 DUF58 domain-containing protein [Nocardioides carbamazepini]
MALLTKIKTRLALHARRPVSGLLEGRYASTLAGRSLDFSDLREYQPGDDVADIDWKASARHGGLLVKRYVADRKHTVFLVVDTGRELAALAGWRPDGPGADGPGADGPGAARRDLVITAAGVLGWIAISHGDYVGLVHGGDDGPTILRPSTSELELERMLGLIEASSRATSGNQDPVAVMEHAVMSIRRRTIMFLLLGDIEVDGGIEAVLRRLLVQHEVVLITVGDLDPTGPGRSGRAVRDVGTGRRFPRFAAESATLAAEIEAATADRAERRRTTLTRLGVAHLHLDDPDRVIGDLLALVERMRRVR